MVYVGFWRRLGAHIIDAVIIGVSGYLIAFILLFVLAGTSGNSHAQTAPAQPAITAPAAVQPPVTAQPITSQVVPQPLPAQAVPGTVTEHFSVTVPATPATPPTNSVQITTDKGTKTISGEDAASFAGYALLGGFMMIVWTGHIILGTFYHTLFVASKWQATPGKRLVGAMVVTEDGKRIGILRALGRHVSCIFSAMILLFGYFMIGWTREKTGLHDVICGTRVIRGEA